MKLLVSEGKTHALRDCFAVMHLFWQSANKCPTRFQDTIRNEKTV